jgi:hypothetical protein
VFGYILSPRPAEGNDIALEQNSSRGLAIPAENQRILRHARCHRGPSCQKIGVSCTLHDSLLQANNPLSSCPNHLTACQRLLPLDSPSTLVHSFVRRSSTLHRVLVRFVHVNTRQSATAEPSPPSPRLPAMPFRLPHTSPRAVATAH